MTRSVLNESLRWPLLIASIAVPSLCVVWAHWPTLTEIQMRWAHDPQYSHGYLVPIFAVILLALRSGKVGSDWPAPSWWGLVILGIGLAMRLLGGYFYYVWFDQFSLVPCLVGSCLMLGGKTMWRWAWPALLFLAFMIPMPFRLETAMAHPLQRLATVVSTFFLQTFGLPALAEGNRILLDDKEIGIVEACSGLRMLVVFFALSAGVALVIQRRTWERLLILVSAIPIALISNVIRITATGVLLETTSGETAHVFFHDLAGWFMMPLALAMLGLELMVLTKLLLDRTATSPVQVGLTTTGLLTAAPSPKRQPWKRYE